METRLQEILRGSINDWFSWDLYNKLPKSGNSDILGLTNQFRPKIYSAWHVKESGIAFHTRRYILKRAILENDLNDIKVALDGGFDVNQVIDFKYQLTPLSLAAILNRTAVIQYLHLRGGDPDKLDGSLTTPLMHAVKNWNFDSIKVLVEDCYADINKLDGQGQTAKDKAEFKNLTAIIKYFDQITEKREEIRREKIELMESKRQEVIAHRQSQRRWWQRKESKSLESEQPFEKFQDIKPFPKFTVDFKFEKLFADTAGQTLVRDKKFYTGKYVKYPFNNFKGLYRITFLQSYTLSQAQKSTTITPTTD